MSENKKGRVWWIVWKSGYKNQATVLEEKPKAYNDSLTHVIEHSSYQKAVNALKEFALGESQWLDGVECMHKAREVLRELGEV